VVKDIYLKYFDMVNLAHIEIKEKIKAILNEDVYKISRPCPRRKLVYLVELNNQKIRFDFKRGSVVIGFKEEARLQMVAYDNGVKVPKILFVDDNIKISQWIDGIEMNNVRRESEPNIQLGKLIGHLNITQDDDKYLSLIDLTNKNSIWTGKELYFIDFCGLRTVDYEEVVRQTSIGMGARIHSSRWLWFIEGYLYYFPDLDINSFIFQANEKLKYRRNKKRERNMR